MTGFLGERERFANPQPGSPQHDDQRAETHAIGAPARSAHHCDDLIEGGWVCWVASAFVAGWAAGVIAGAPGYHSMAMPVRRPRASPWPSTAIANLATDHVGARLGTAVGSDREPEVDCTSVGSDRKASRPRVGGW